MTNDDLKNYLEQVQDKYKYKKVILFGSRANGNNRDDSDIDLLVEFDKKHKSLLNIARMINDIQNRFKLDVDVVPYPVPNTIAGLELRVDKEVLLYG